MNINITNIPITYYIPIVTIEENNISINLGLMRFLDVFRTYNIKEAEQSNSLLILPELTIAKVSLAI